MTVGRRIQTVRQLLNVREGLDLFSLAISPRAAGHPPLTHGANRGRSVPLRPLMHGYWERMGWNGDTGIPSAQTLQELGIEGSMISPVDVSEHAGTASR